MTQRERFKSAWRSYRSWYWESIENHADHPGEVMKLEWAYYHCGADMMQLVDRIYDGRQPWSMKKERQPGFFAAEFRIGDQEDMTLRQAGPQGSGT